MPESLSLHEHRVFYKYMTREAAAATLTHMTTRWSSPLLYNDPFDTPNNISFTFPVEAVPAVAMMMMQLVVEDPGQGMPAEPVVADAIVKARAATGAAETLIPLLTAATQAGLEAQQYLRFTNALWETKLEAMRVFCVSEVFDDLLMWAHYAECHRGVVIGFKCMNDTTTDLCAARRVVYAQELPVVNADPVDWVRRYFQGNFIKPWPDADQQRAYDAMMLTKSEHWGYEKEWRCFGKEDYDCLAISPKHKDDLVRSVPLRAEEVDAVYIGCRMYPEEERAFRRLVQEKLGSTTRVLRGRQSRSIFGLEFS